MKKLWLIIFVLLFGCAGVSPTKPSSDTEARIKALEQKIKQFEMMTAAGGAAATDRIWPFYGRTGGGNALDGILEGNIGDYDCALGSALAGSDRYGYFYCWNDTYNQVVLGCDDPNCIPAADDIDETGAWINIKRWYAEGMYSSAADGDHFIDPSNDDAFPVSGVVEGAVTCIDDRDACFLYDGTNWIPIYARKYVEKVDDDEIDSDDCWGAVITNNGADGLITLTLPSAVKYMMCTFSVVDEDGDLYVKALGGDDIQGVNVDIRLIADGDSVTVYAISAADWIILSDAGSPTYN